MGKVGIIMGSDTDLPKLKSAFDVLEQFGIEYEITICSAHRLPKDTAVYAEGAIERGLDVIIAAAGGAAHLPGVVAAHTVLPVIGVPVQSQSLNGLDSLYSIVQMPRGIPVACVAIDGSINAVLLAIEIIAVRETELRSKLHKYRAKMAQEVRDKDARLKRIGAEAYLKTKGVK